MSDGLGTVIASHIHHELGDERPAECRGKWIFAFVNSAGGKRRPDEAIDEQVAGIYGDGIDSARAQRLLADLFDVLTLAKIDRESNNVEVVLLPNPGDHHRSVEP